MKRYRLKSTRCMLGPTSSGNLTLGSLLSSLIKWLGWLRPSGSEPVWALRERSICCGGSQQHKLRNRPKVRRLRLGEQSLFVSLQHWVQVSEVSEWALSEVSEWVQVIASWLNSRNTSGNEVPCSCVKCSAQNLGNCSGHQPARFGETWSDSGLIPVSTMRVA